MEPKISIIIPTFNRVSLIGQTLDSILAQTYRNWECIIIDDASTDYTPELIEFYNSRDSRIKYYTRPARYPKGANSCRNYGVDVSKGEYINWFDSDDLMEPAKIEKQVALLESDSDISVCVSPYILCDNKMTPIRQMPIRKEERLFNDYLTGRSYFNFQSVLFRKNSLKLKPDPNLAKAQELEFFIRYLWQPEIKIKVLPEYLVQIRLHKGNITSKFEAGDVKAINSEMEVRLNALKVLREIGGSQDLKDGLQIYCRFLLSLLKQHKIWKYFKYVFKLYIVLPRQYYFWILRLIFLGFIRLLFKKQPYRFRKLLNFST